MISDCLLSLEPFICLSSSLMTQKKEKKSSDSDASGRFTITTVCNLKQMSD